MSAVVSPQQGRQEVYEVTDEDVTSYLSVRMPDLTDITPGELADYKTQLQVQANDGRITKETFPSLNDTIEVLTSETSFKS